MNTKNTAATGTHGDTSTMIRLKPIDLSIAGLNSITDFNMFRVSTPHSLGSSLAMDLLNLSVRMEVEVNSTVDAPPFSEELTLVFDISDFSLYFDMLLPMDMNSTANLSFWQLRNGNGCFLSNVESVNLTSNLLNLTVENLSIHTSNISHGGALTGDVSSFFNSIAELLIVSYSEMMTASFMGVASGPELENLNEQSTQRLFDRAPSLTCPPAEYQNVSESEPINWRESNLVALFDELINHLIGLDGLDAVLRCPVGGATDNTSASYSFHISPDGWDGTKLFLCLFILFIYLFLPPFFLPSVTELHLFLQQHLEN